MASTTELQTTYRRRLDKVTREVQALELTIQAAAYYIQRLESEATHAQALAAGIH